jgi:hypothetical protein
MTVARDQGTTHSYHKGLASLSFPYLSKQRHLSPNPRLSTASKISPKNISVKDTSKSKDPHHQRSTLGLPLPSVGSAICGTSQDCRMLGEYNFTQDFCSQSISNTSLENDFYHEVHAIQPSIVEAWLPKPQEAPKNTYGKQPSLTNHTDDLLNLQLSCCPIYLDHRN